MAEGILRAKAQDAGLELEIDSAATAGWHVGNPPDARAVVASRIKGYNIEDQMSRRFRSDDFETFDYIIAMDEAIRRDIEAKRPAGKSVPIVLMSSFGPDAEDVDVPDPYYTGKFMPVIALLEGYVDGLVAQLLTDRQ